MNTSKKFEKMAEVYKLFGYHDHYDYSEDAKLEMYRYETYGDCGGDKEAFLERAATNGYFQGKKWMDVQLAMWKEDIGNGSLFKYELYEDGTYPEWWLDEVLAPIIAGKYVGDPDRKEFKDHQTIRLMHEAYSERKKRKEELLAPLERVRMCRRGLPSTRRSMKQGYLRFTHRKVVYTDPETYTQKHYYVFRR